MRSRPGRRWWRRSSRTTRRVSAAVRRSGWSGCCGCTWRSSASICRKGGSEDAVYDSQAIRSFVGIDLSRENAPNATTLLQFRWLLEQHKLTQVFFHRIDAHLQQWGLMLREGTVVEATLIAAPPLTKKREKPRDPEMH